MQINVIEQRRCYMAAVTDFIFAKAVFATVNASWL